MAVQRVVLDTNALMVPFELGLRIEDELDRLLGSYDAIVPEAVLEELATIAATDKGRRARNAKAALAYATRFRFVRMSGTKKSGDAAVLAAARAEGAFVLTNDKELMRRVLASGLGVIWVKGKSRLVVETRQGQESS